MGKNDGIAVTQRLPGILSNGHSYDSCPSLVQTYTVLSQSLAQACLKAFTLAIRSV